MSRFKWTVEIEVDAFWIADGFDVTEYVNRGDGGPDALIELGDAAKWMRFDEAKVTLISAPDPKDIRREQGYSANEGGAS